eukprot:9749366-Heterocapsa_arctica.AAC.1
MVSAGLANGAESKVESEAAVAKHKPVRLKIGGELREDMGMIIRRPMAFQGMTRKETKVYKVLEGDFVMRGEDLDEQWRRWNEPSENTIGNVVNKTGNYHKGRRTGISFVKT